MVRVGTDSSAAAGITQRLGFGRVRHLEVQDLWKQVKVRSHELEISRVKSEDKRADLLIKFVHREQHHKLIMQPLSVSRTSCGLAYSVASGVVCSLLPVRAKEGNQMHTMRKNIEEISVVAGWLAKRSTTQVVEFWDMTNGRCGGHGGC